MPRELHATRAAYLLYARLHTGMFELKTARDSGKPIITCVVEPGFWTTWTLPDGSRAVPDDHEWVALARLKSRLFVDLGAASRVNWQHEPVPLDERRRLTHAPEALPRLLKQIKEARMALGLEGGGGGGRVPASTPPTPVAIASARKAAVLLASGAGGQAAAVGAGDAAGLATVTRAGAFKKTESWRG